MDFTAVLSVEWLGLYVLGVFFATCILLCLLTLGSYTSSHQQFVILVVLSVLMLLLSYRLDNAVFIWGENMFNNRATIVFTQFCFGFLVLLKFQGIIRLFGLKTYNYGYKLDTYELRDLRTELYKGHEDEVIDSLYAHAQAKYLDTDHCARLSAMKSRLDEAKYLSEKNEIYRADWIHERHFMRKELDEFIQREMSALPSRA